MGLAWDGNAEAVVVEAVAATDEPIDEEAILSDSDEGPDALRVTITPMAARAFVARARRVVAAGRPAVPAVLAAAGPGRARLPAAERLPPLTGALGHERATRRAADAAPRPADDAEALPAAARRRDRPRGPAARRVAT